MLAPVAATKRSARSIRASGGRAGAHPFFQFRDNAICDPAVNVSNLCHFETPFRCHGEAAPRCFPGPRERWRWKEKTGFSRDPAARSRSAAEAEEAGTEACLGERRGEAFRPPLRPRLRPYETLLPREGSSPDKAETRPLGIKRGSGRSLEPGPQDAPYPPCEGSTPRALSLSGRKPGDIDQGNHQVGQGRHNRLDSCSQI